MADTLRAVQQRLDSTKTVDRAAMDAFTDVSGTHWGRIFLGDAGHPSYKSSKSLPSEDYEWKPQKLAKTVQKGEVDSRATVMESSHA